MRLKKFLNEGKENIINKIPSLSSAQKEEIIDFFKQHRNIENLINWNNWRKLTYEDFSKIMKQTKEKKLKKGNTPISLSGLKEGINGDYVDVSYIFNNDGYSGKFKDWYAYIPLTYRGSKYIGRHHVGKCVTKWCTASDNKKYWNRYIIVDDTYFIYLVSPDGKDKYAIALLPYSSTFDLYDKNNKVTEMSITSSLGKVISTYKKSFKIYFDAAYENAASTVPYTPDDLRNAYEEYIRYLYDVGEYIKEYTDFVQDYNYKFNTFKNYAIKIISEYINNNDKFGISKEDKDKLDKLLLYIKDIKEMENYEQTPIDDIINTIHEYHYMYKNKKWLIDIENKIGKERPKIDNFREILPSINDYPEYKNVLGVELGTDNFDHIDDILMDDINKKIKYLSKSYTSIPTNYFFDNIGLYNPEKMDNLWGD